jgi:hypothetical protein
LRRSACHGTLALMPFEPLSSKAQAELEKEGAALLRFVEPDADTVDVRFGKAPAGGSK